MALLPAKELRSVGAYVAHPQMMHALHSNRYPPLRWDQLVMHDVFPLREIEVSVRIHLFPPTPHFLSDALLLHMQE